MERYNIGLYVTGQFEFDEMLFSPEEIAAAIADEIDSSVNLYWPQVDIDYLESVNKKENTREVNPT